MLTVSQTRPSFLRVCQLFLRCSAQPTLRHHELHLLPGCAEIGAWQATNELETMETIPPPQKKKWPKYDSTRLKCQNDSKWEQDINISHISHIYNNENIFKTSKKNDLKSTNYPPTRCPLSCVHLLLHSDDLSPPRSLRELERPNQHHVDQLRNDLRW